MSEKICKDCCTQFNSFCKFREQVLTKQNVKIAEINRHYRAMGCNAMVEPFRVQKSKLIALPPEPTTSRCVETETGIRSVGKIHVPLSQSIKIKKEMASRLSDLQVLSPQTLKLRARKYQTADRITQEHLKKPSKKMRGYEDDDFVVPDPDSDSSGDKNIPKSLKKRRSSRKSFTFVDIKKIFDNKSDKKTFCDSDTDEEDAPPKTYRKKARESIDSIIDLTDM